MKILSLSKHENRTTSKNIVKKRRNCSWGGAISPLFHNIFDIALSSRVQLHINLLNVIVRIIFSAILKIWYVEVRRYGSVSESPLEFEISRVTVFKSKKHTFWILVLELPHWGDSNKYPKPMFCEEKRVNQCLLYISLCSLKDTLLKQFYFNGNIFGNKCCCNEGSLYMWFTCCSCFNILFCFVVLFYCYEAHVSQLV